MSPTLAEAIGERDGCAAPYQRHRPERTLLYQIVEQHYRAFVTHLDNKDASSEPARLPPSRAPPQAGLFD